MRIIGITGPIGSGKSTVSCILAEIGVKVIDADRTARKVVEKGERALNELAEYFGSGILNEKGELDRNKLAGIVFNNKKSLKVLNSITHKYIVEEILKDLNSIRVENEGSIVALDVPIPVEHGFLDIVDEVWVVTADSDKRIKRIMERSGFTREEAANRINSQMGEADYLRLADRIIYNEGSLDDLRRTVTKLLHNEGQ